MARIRIRDLNQNTRITSDEMRNVIAGGLASSPMGLRPGAFWGGMLVTQTPDPAGRLSLDHPGTGGMVASRSGVWDDTDIVH